MDLRDRLKKLEPEFEPTTIKATSAHRSSEVVKRVSKSEFAELDKRLRPILKENDDVLIESYIAAKDDWVR